LKHDFIDKYANRDSLIHRLDPRAKFVTTFAFLLAVVLTPIERWQAFALYLFLITVLIAISKLPPLFVMKRSLVIVPFVLMIAVFNLFFKTGEEIAGFGVLSWHISITREGLLIFASVMAKAWLSILSLILLSSTTTLTSLLRGMEQLGLPKVMVMILSFMYRYIFVLTDEVMRMKQARDSRNFGGRHLWQLKTIGNMIGTIFIRSYERAERVYAAMLARGFEGQVRTANRLRFKPVDLHFTASIFAIVVAIAFVPF